tara:strand:+ start:393 stop:788 length:396 start_codon:yes stop_codon:yes gene_type:complete
MKMLLLMMSVAIAEEPVYTELKINEPAPFAGYLLDHDALNILSDAAKIGIACPIEIDYQVGLMEAKKQQELDLQISEYQFHIDNLEATLANQKERIQTLEKAKKPIHWAVWLGAGFVLGTGSTIAIANAVK